MYTTSPAFASGPSFGKSFAKSALLMLAIVFCVKSHDLFNSSMIRALSVVDFSNVLASNSPGVWAPIRRRIPTFSRDMEENLGKRAGVRRGPPVEFILRNRVGQFHKLLLHRLKVEQRLPLHVVTRGSATGCA